MVVHIEGPPQQYQQNKGKPNPRAGGRKGRNNGGEAERTTAALQQDRGNDTTRSASTTPAARTSRPPREGGQRPPRSCFKCGDLTHSVFQFPQVKDYAEANSINLSKTDKNERSSRSVGVAGLDVPDGRNIKRTLSCQTSEAPLVVRNVVCGISPVPFPAGVGGILLSDAVMERLGYDPHKPIESAQLVQSDYDLGDIGSPDHNPGVCALGATSRELTPGGSRTQ
ncbi:unnamed protein product [Phytophthora fragariaefolia]|uniref:Unnamed protein product n=1 Tax=Phytophthora fragariaefolia TaxID=1490495 RepID=A0A9W6X764_9STRA|nr:unnamed protein product [Phytophthora fragariaefolia]